MDMSTAPYLTPRPTQDRFTLLVCPPPPRRVEHEPRMDSTNSFPALNFPLAFRDESSSSSAPSFIPGVTKKSGTKTLFVKRSHFGLNKNNSSNKPAPSLMLQPRPSKYTLPNRAVSTLNRSSSKTNLGSMTRSASFQRMFMLSDGSRNKRSKLSRRPSLSRAA